jgi:hypothetical protein
MRVFWISSIALLAFALAGCAPAQPNADVTSSDTLVPASEEASSTALPDSTNQGDTAKMTPTTAVDPSLQNLIEQAKQDLAKRSTALLITQINVIEAKTLVWPDSSLGCPQPGMRYKQVPEDGALIVLEADGITYEYHSGGRRGVFLCQKASTKASPPPQIDLLSLTPSSPGTPDPDSPSPDNSIPPGEDR